MQLLWQFWVAHSYYRQSTIMQQQWRMRVHSGVSKAWGQRSMWVIFVEATAAAVLFVFIVWWTMFSGKKPPPQKTDEENGQS